MISSALLDQGCQRMHERKAANRHDSASALPPAPFHKPFPLVAREKFRKSSMKSQATRRKSLFKLFDFVLIQSQLFVARNRRSQDSTNVRTVLTQRRTWLTSRIVLSPCFRSYLLITSEHRFFLLRRKWSPLSIIASERRRTLDAIISGTKGKLSNQIKWDALLKWVVIVQSIWFAMQCTVHRCRWQD